MASLLKTKFSLTIAEGNDSTKSFDLRLPKKFSRLLD